MPDEITFQIIARNDLTDAVYADILRLCSAAYGMDFTPYLAYPASIHVLGYRDAALVSHALWVARWLQAGALPPLRTAYVEAVATDPQFEGRGYASAVLRRLIEAVADYDLAALSPSDPAFYARLGWKLWRGPLSIRTAAGNQPTPDETAMIHRLPQTPALDLAAPLSAEWRAGELW